MKSDLRLFIDLQKQQTLNVLNKLILCWAIHVHSYTGVHVAQIHMLIESFTSIRLYQQP